MASKAIKFLEQAPDKHAFLQCGRCAAPCAEAHLKSRTMFGIYRYGRAFGSHTEKSAHPKEDP